MMSRSQTTHLSRFAELIRLPDAEIPLAEASLEIARDEYADLDVAPYLQLIDELTAVAMERDPGPGEPVRKRLESLNTVLFEEHGFSGEGGRFDDPRSSYLNDVLDRRTGLPVTLSVLYLEIGRRLGINVSGVGMPGHFILRLQDEDPPLFIDPYRGGRILSRDECATLLQEVTDGRLQMQPEYLRPCSTLKRKRSLPSAA